MLWVGGASGETPDFVAPKFGEPEGIVRSGRDFAAVAAGWQPELTDLASRGDVPDLAALPFVARRFSKPEGTVRTGCDADGLGAGRQRELADLPSWGHASNCARFGEPEVAIWPGCDARSEIIGW